MAEFTLPQPLRLCGLHLRTIETSPFDGVDEYLAEKAIADVANEMGKMFARPIRKSDTDTDYVITQFLARMIREASTELRIRPANIPKG